MSVIIRKNIDTMLSGEWNRFVSALNVYKTPPGPGLTSPYDLLTQHHATAMNTLTLFPGETGTSRNVAHRGPAFFTWHRQALRELELSLCAIQAKLFPHDSVVGMPYWRWNVNSVGWRTAAIWNRVGGNGVSTNGYRINTGPFRNWNSTIISGSGFTSRAGIVRKFRTTGTMPVWGDTSSLYYDASPWNEYSLASDSFRVYFEPRHNLVHTMIGGDMTAPTSPNDPLFWFHHCNVDRAWARWQGITRQGITGVTSYQPNGEGPTGHNRFDIPTLLDSTAQNKFNNDMLNRFNFDLDVAGSGFDYDTLVP